MPSRNPVYDAFHEALRVQDELTPKWETLESEDVVVHVLIIPDDTATLLQEGRWEALNNRFKVRFDRAIPGGKDHYHVAKAKSGNDLFVMNADGTGSHRFKNHVIPNEVAKLLKDRYGDKIRIPPNNVLEELPADAVRVLIEDGPANS